MFMEVRGRSTCLERRGSGRSAVLVHALAAACRNVVVKLGGLGMIRCGFGWSEQPVPPTSAALVEVTAPYYLFCIEHLGPDRCTFESNFPVDELSYSYNVVWNSFKRMTQGFSATERAVLFQDTAVRVYRLGRGGRP